MKKYTFLCGGDRGAWESEVTIELSEEEEEILKLYAENDRNEFIDRFHPTESIWSKIVHSLEEQCDDDFDSSMLVVRIPNGLK